MIVVADTEGGIGCDGLEPARRARALRVLISFRDGAQHIAMPLVSVVWYAKRKYPSTEVLSESITRVNPGFAYRPTPPTAAFV